MHNHQSALDSQREEAEINWLFPEPDNDDIYEKLYEEEVQESLDRLEKLGFKDINEYDDKLLQEIAWDYILKNPDKYRVGEPDLDNEDILDWNVFDEVKK